MHAPDALRDGDHFRPVGQPHAFLLHGGARWRYPDDATLQACTGGYPAVVRPVDTPPEVPERALPSASAHPWMSGLRPVKAAGSPAVYVVIGCVRSPVPDPEAFEALFGAAGWRQVIEVARAVLDSVPGGAQARVPVRRAGELIKAPESPEVRWVLQVGNARSIPSLTVLQSYCRTDVTMVDAAEFAGYPAAGALGAASAPCETSLAPPGSGEHFRVSGSAAAYLSFGGEAWAYPDRATLLACTAGNLGVVRPVPAAPALVFGRGLPSAAAHAWLDGTVPVKASDHPAVYVVVGCVKAAVRDGAIFEAIFGPGAAARVVEVAPEVLDSVPTGPAARLPFRPYGTRLRGNAPEIRWVTYAGGSLAVPTLETLGTYCPRPATTTSDAEFEAYPSRGILPVSAEPCADANVAEGEHFRVTGSPHVYLAFGGAAWRYRDLETLRACTGGYPAISRELSRLPELPVHDLPSARTHAWLSGDAPVRAAGRPEILLVNGCARAWIQDATVLTTLFGADGFDQVVTVPAATLDSLPRSGPVLLPLRRAGTVLRERGTGRMRWVTQAGVALAVDAAGSLLAHCRAAVTMVEPGEFARYGGHGTLHRPAAPCPAPASELAVQPDFRLPVPGALRWLVAVAAGGAAGDGAFDARHTGDAHYALDLVDAQAGAPRPPVLAAAAGTVVALGQDTESSTDFVVLEHGAACAECAPYSTRYGFLERGSLLVQPGQLLAAGARLGTAAQREDGRAPVHFEVRYRGRGEASAAWLEDTRVQERRITEFRAGRGYSAVDLPAHLPAVDTRAIASGMDHACGLGSDGRAYCWGRNQHGQLGTGNRLDAHEPVPVSGGRQFVSLALSTGHSCALDPDGRAFCWGANAYGELGNGGVQPALAPTPVGGGYFFARLSAGTGFTCGLTRTGVALCWGRNEYGLLGSGTVGGHATMPVRVSGGRHFLAIDAGPEGACAAAAAGGIYCWGVVGWTSVAEPRLLSQPPADRTYTEVALAGGHGCALEQNGRAHCWSDGGHRSRLLESPLTFTNVTVGHEYSCGLTAAGELYCQGFVPGIGGRPQATHVLPESRFHQVDAQGALTCFVERGGAGGCFGTDQFGTLGDGYADRSPWPRRVADAPEFISLSSHGDATCGLTADGRAYCWGSGAQLPSGAQTSATPLRVESDAAFASISLGTDHACALTADGAAYCWGSNAVGQLGTAEPCENGVCRSPRPVQTTLRFGRITAGHRHTCAISRQGGTFCWGANDYGQLGDGTTTPRNTPHPIAGGHAFVLVSAGGDHGGLFNFDGSHTCALTADGVAYCWGDSFYGQAGQTSRSLFPAEVPTTLRFRALSAGGQHTCALDLEGAPHCWGRANLGVLGANPAVELCRQRHGHEYCTPVPQRVSASLRFGQIESGSGQFACAWSTGADLYCWGAARNGTIGGGATPDAQPSPAGARIEAVHALAAGSAHACALVAGETYCWGANASHQRGEPIPVRHVSRGIGGIPFRTL